MSEGLGLSDEARKAYERVNTKYVERHGRNASFVRVMNESLIGSVCKVVNAGDDFITLMCGEYKVTLSATIGVGDIELEASVTKVGSGRKG